MDVSEVSPESLAEFVDGQPISSVGKKISRDGYDSDVFRFSLSEETFEKDLTFLDKHKSNKILAVLRLANKYSQFGFHNLDDDQVFEIAQKVERLSIGLEFKGAKCVEQLLHLEYLSLFELVSTTKAASQEINLNQLRNLKTLTLPVRERSSNQIRFDQLVGLEVLHLNHYRGAKSKFHSIENLANLKILDLFRCKVSNFESLTHLTELKFLACDYARNLSDISALENLQKIEKIEFQNCPNLSNLEPLGKLPNLKVLKLMNCRSIESLSFLQNTNLEYLEFIDTAVEDNDVAFLDKMPNLRMFRYSNKRLYMPQRKDTLDVNTTKLWNAYSSKGKELEKVTVSEQWRLYTSSREAYV